jgi:urease accessory protein
MMFMSTEINLEDLSFLQLADSLFPTGLYATSSGLEALSYTKKLKPNDIRGLIDVYLRQQVGPSDCTALGNTYESIKKSDLHGLIDADQTLYSMRIIEAVRNASIRSGIQLLKCVSSFVKQNLILEGYLKVVKNGEASGIYPVSFAVASWSLDIPKLKAGLMLLYGFTVSVIGAALRLGVIQHFDAQVIIHDLKPCILESVQKNIDRPLSGMWQFSPGIDILQIKHEQMDSKMFIT